MKIIRRKRKEKRKIEIDTMRLYVTAPYNLISR
jgi:hypothetical protein